MEEKCPPKAMFFLGGIIVLQQHEREMGVWVWDCPVQRKTYAIVLPNFPLLSIGSGTCPVLKLARELEE